MKLYALFVCYIHFLFRFSVFFGLWLLNRHDALVWFLTFFNLWLEITLKWRIHEWVRWIKHKHANVEHLGIRSRFDCDWFDKSSFRLEIDWHGFRITSDSSSFKRWVSAISWYVCWKVSLTMSFFNLMTSKQWFEWYIGDQRVFFFDF